MDKRAQPNGMTFVEIEGNCAAKCCHTPNVFDVFAMRNYDQSSKRDEQTSTNEAQKIG